MSNRYKILIVENNEDIKRTVGFALKEKGYKILKAKGFADGNMMFFSHMPDVVLINLDYSDGKGESLLREIRKSSGIPIIAVSKKNDEAELIRVLEMGANDYVRTPVSCGELMARIRAAIRNYRYVHTHSEVLEINGLSVNYDLRKVFVNGREIKLTQTEYNIAVFLAVNNGRVMPYSSIIKAVWGYSDYGSVKKLQVNVANIRKKIESVSTERRFIDNEPGVGYIMLDK